MKKVNTGETARASLIGRQAQVRLKNGDARISTINLLCGHCVKWWGRGCTENGQSSVNGAGSAPSMPLLRCRHYGSSQPSAAVVSDNAVYACSRPWRSREARHDPARCSRAEQNAIPGRRIWDCSTCSCPDRLDTAAIDQTLGAKGVINGGVYQFNIPRAEAIMDEGIAIPISMGTAPPTSSRHAAVTGDLVLVAKEVNPVLNELLGHDVEMTALHSHMLDDPPRPFFMHFWANDDAQNLAKGLLAALDKIAIKKS